MTTSPKRGRAAARITAAAVLAGGLAAALASGPANAGEVFVKSVQLASSDAKGKAGNRGSGWGVVSPDGRTVAFLSQATSFGSKTVRFESIFLKDLKTGAIRLATPPVSGSEVNGHSEGLVFSPGGSYLAFSSDASNLVPNDTNESRDVFRVPVRGGSVSRVSLDTAARQLKRHSFLPAISPDGSSIAYQHNGTIRLVNVRSLTVKAVSRSSSGKSIRDSRYPMVVKSDGSIGFISAGAVPGLDPRQYLHVKNPKTGVVSSYDMGPLPYDEEDGFNERWMGYRDPIISPDGKYLAFTQYGGWICDDGCRKDSGSYSHGYLLELSTLTKTRVAADAAGFSNDGRWLFTCKEADEWGDGGGVYAYGIGTGEYTQLTEDGVGCEDLSVSRDGRRLVLTTGASLVASDRNGETDVYVLTLGER